MANSKRPDLATILDLRQSKGDIPAEWSAADRAMCEARFADAAAAYAAAGDKSSGEQAKHGFCLAALDRHEEADGLLTEENVGSHPTAKALLAYNIAGENGRRLLRGFTKQKQETNDAKAALSERLFDESLAGERPPIPAFDLYFAASRSASEKVVAAATRALGLYPEWARPYAIVVNDQCNRSTPDRGLVEKLLSLLPGTGYNREYDACFRAAVVLQDWALVECVLDKVDEELSKVENTDADAEAGRTWTQLLRRMMLVQRLREGKLESQRLTTADLVLPEGTAHTHATAKFAAMLLIEAGELQGDNLLLQEGCRALTDLAWDSTTAWVDYLAEWSAFIRCGNRSFTFYTPWFHFAESAEALAEGLNTSTRDRWLLLTAAAKVAHEEASESQLDLLRAAPLDGQPLWVLYSAATANLMEGGDPAKAGACAAELAERCAGTSDPDAGEMDDPLFSVFLEPEDDQVPSYIEGATAWLASNPQANGTEFLKRWGSDLLAAKDAAKPMVHLARLSLARNHTPSTAALLEEALEAEDPRYAIAKALAAEPQPEQTRVRPDALSLLEAAMLIAVLRSGDLDHATWTLAPLGNSPYPFAPSSRYNQMFWHLVEKGVLAMDAARSGKALSINESGQLSAVMMQVVWRVAPNTLALEQEIRSMRHYEWPDAWRDQARSLLRDLGVDELVRYFEYQLDLRRLPMPAEEEVRAIFRLQLDHLAIAQCYYLAYKTAKEALDYQVKHRPGVRQLHSRTLTLLRGNGDKCIAHGWDQRYERIRDLPPTLLWQAFADVLTGWGSKAFLEPAHTLDWAPPVATRP